jgi:hypothetical protein
MYIFAGFEIAGGIIFFIWCTKIHRKSSNKQWLIASWILSVGFVLAGVISIRDEYNRMSNMEWEIREDGSRRPIKNKSNVD